MDVNLAALDPKVARRRAMAELRRNERAAAQAAAHAARAAREDEARRRRVARAEQRRIVRRERAERRAELAVALTELGRRVRPVTPILLVTAFAMYGQIGYVYDHATEPAWPTLLRLMLAVGAAVTIESIANTVAWYAHVSLIEEATAEAARRRWAAYGIALLVAALNYAHFAGPGLAPTPAGIMFAAFSAAQPWLWGMHSRRVKHVRLVQNGKADEVGPTFSGERWRAFPLRTYLARRWAIDRGVADPREAWEGYRQYRTDRRAAVAATRAERAATTATDDQLVSAGTTPAEAGHEATNLSAGGVSPLRKATPLSITPASAFAVPAASRGRRGRVRAVPVRRLSPRPRTRRAPRPRRSRSELLANPPQVAIELVRSTSVGWQQLTKQLHELHRIKPTEYEAKELIRRYRTSKETQ